MKWKIGIFLAVLAAMAPMVNPVIVNIEVGDRPYYIHGISMGRAITSVALTGFGFQGIGVGVTNKESGFTATTHRVN